MAVTINEMDVEVQGAKPQQEPAAGQSSSPKEPMNMRQEMEKLEERRMRLRAD